MTYSNRSEGSPFQHRSEFNRSPPVDSQLKKNQFINNMQVTSSRLSENAKPAHVFWRDLEISPTETKKITFY